MCNRNTQTPFPCVLNTPWKYWDGFQQCHTNFYEKSTSHNQHMMNCGFPINEAKNVSVPSRQRRKHMNIFRTNTVHLCPYDIAVALATISILQRSKQGKRSTPGRHFYLSLQNSGAHGPMGDIPSIRVSFCSAVN